MEHGWGLLGPELVPKARRTRTLGLGASVRLFNDLAVPGLGGVWYGKQILLATLGVAVADDARNRGTKVSNIEVANAVEALACGLAFKSNDWRPDARLRGSTKLKGTTDFSFRRMRQRLFYVTQPMRMATVQALPALGFVETSSPRFNGFRCTEAGRTFIEQATKNFSPSNRSVCDHLTKWVLGESDKLGISRPLTEALSPLRSLSKDKDAVLLLRERLLQGGQESDQDKKRRYQALTWVDALRNGSVTTPTWESLPQQLSEEHWRDLRAGALFSGAREAALETLDAVETYIGNQSSRQLMSLSATVPKALNATIDTLRSAAGMYLRFGHANEEARDFCSECVNDKPSSILYALVKRDGHVLRLVGDEIVPGPSFRGSIPPTDSSEDQATPLEDDIALPEGISYRVRNLYLLNLDLHDELDRWLGRG